MGLFYTHVIIIFEVPLTHIHITYKYTKNWFLSFVHLLAILTGLHFIPLLHWSEWDECLLPLSVAPHINKNEKYNTVVIVIDLPELFLSFMLSSARATFFFFLYVSSDEKLIWYIIYIWYILKTVLFPFT